MKLISSFLSLCVIFSLTFIYSCGPSAAVSLNEQQKDAKILDEGSPWGGMGNVEVLSSPSGVDPSDLANLQVVFSTEGEDELWAPTFFETSGADDFLSTDGATWNWLGSGTDNIKLIDASVAELTSVAVTDDDVTFSFEVNSSSSGGRVTGIDGSYSVKLR